jgi:hypothetical protein
MLQQLRQFGLNIKVWMLALALLAGVMFLIQPAPAQAHCDAINGPVVTAARAALESGDVKLVLPYVRPEYEAELVAAFQHTLEVRKLGAEAEALADHFFFETAVRLHRTGEGAPYTGLKAETDHGPALAAAAKALETGSLSEVYTLLDEAIQQGVAQKYEAVQIARTEAAQAGAVEAQRERVEAELIFETYIYELYNAIQGESVHAEGAGEIHSHSAEE